ncbi:gamma-glutamyl-gamma-aminobutyrate hydrolase family protein [Haloferula sp. BvORR071]|uniref:gamma-glutamyl-gamma-aminobutyrate hydrolase family protein n=1 Tax=Haloferula sp. BvORR071 TaxID=1396141 RepID=UPI00069798D4|nr:gamma-glutamyl-gamma-aminobutyrate hydrolase family protein [Haloferula sp. BvORR071]
MTHRHWLTFAAVFAAAWLGFLAGHKQSDLPTAVAPAALHEAPLIGIASVNADTYVRAVRQAGGIPVILPNYDYDPEAIAGYLDRLDGLLMPGGADIPPAEYGESPHPTIELLDDNRLNFEKALGKAWIEQTKKPLLGICLGSQWINVLKGGSLVQDIPTEIGGNHRATTHLVKLEPNTRLQQIFGESEFEVNSFHHQAVDPSGLGKDLKVAARSPDGVVEATESTDPQRFLIGVQWHPEKLMPADQRQAKLLKAFVEAAAKGQP